MVYDYRLNLAVRTERQHVASDKIGIRLQVKFVSKNPTGKPVGVVRWEHAEDVENISLACFFAIGNRINCFYAKLSKKNRKIYNWKIKILKYKITQHT